MARKRNQPNASTKDETKRPALFILESRNRGMEKVTARRVSNQTLKKGLSPFLISMALLSMANNMNQLNYHVMLANKFTDQDPSGYWLSEKYDGVRAVWDGKQFYSRNGKPFNAPLWFTEKMPKDVVLDGELWEARGQFQTTVGRIRANNGDWSEMKFMIFDTINEQPFESRQESLSQLCLPKHCHLVEHTRCIDFVHFKTYEENILKLGGEGVILRKPTSLYEQKRSDNLLKAKQFYTDEARVIRHIKGKGENRHKCVTLVCLWRDKKFQLSSGLTDELKEKPPHLGSKITFSFFEKTLDGNPRHPVFLAIRDYEGPPRIKDSSLCAKVDLIDTVTIPQELKEYYRVYSVEEHNNKYDLELMKKAASDPEFLKYSDKHLGYDMLDKPESFCMPDIIRAEKDGIYDYRKIIPNNLYREIIWKAYLGFLLNLAPEDQAIIDMFQQPDHKQWQKHCLPTSTMLAP